MNYQVQLKSRMACDVTDYVATGPRLDTSRNVASLELEQKALALTVTLALGLLALCIGAFYSIMAPAQFELTRVSNEEIQILGYDPSPGGIMRLRSLQSGQIFQFKPPTSCEFESAVRPGQVFLMPVSHYKKSSAPEEKHIAIESYVLDSKLCK